MKTMHKCKNLDENKFILSELIAKAVIYQPDSLTLMIKKQFPLKSILKSPSVNNSNRKWLFINSTFPLCSLHFFGIVTTEGFCSSVYSFRTEQRTVKLHKSTNYSKNVFFFCLHKKFKSIMWLQEESFSKKLRPK